MRNPSPRPLPTSVERELWVGPGPLASGESVLWVADSDGGDRNWRWRILLGARAIWCAGLVREAKRISTRGVCLRGCCFYRALECDMVRLVLILCAGGVWVFQRISVWEIRLTPALSLHAGRGSCGLRTRADFLGGVSSGTSDQSSPARGDNTENPHQVGGGAGSLTSA